MRFFVRDNHNDFRCLGAMLAVVATAGLLLSAVPAEAADLTGGKQAKFFDKDGTRKDKMQVRFHKDPGVTAPLPNPASWFLDHGGLRQRGADDHDWPRDPAIGELGDALPRRVLPLS